jgi:hypothetical protein
MICDDRVGNWTPMMDAAGGRAARASLPEHLVHRWRGRSGRCWGLGEEKGEQPFGKRDLLVLAPAPART